MSPGWLIRQCRISRRRQAASAFVPKTDPAHSSASKASDEDKDDHKSGSLMFGLSLVNAWLGAEAAGIVVIRVLIAGIKGPAARSGFG